MHHLMCLYFSIQKSQFGSKVVPLIGALNSADVEGRAQTTGNIFQADDEEDREQLEVQIPATKYTHLTYRMHT